MRQQDTNQITYRYLTYQEWIDFDFSQLLDRLYPRSMQSRLHAVADQYFVCGLLIYVSGELSGRVSLYHNPLLQYKDQTSLCLGTYECIDDDAVSKCLLNQAKEWAREKTMRYILGPMSGSTWQSYRFKTYGTETTFGLEPIHQPYYAAQFNESGFLAIASYNSTMTRLDEIDTDKIRLRDGYFQQLGCEFRQISLSHFEEDLHSVYDCILEGFTQQVFFTPIDRDQFVRQYLRYRSLIDPRLVLFAVDQGGQVHGVVFAILDPTDPTRRTAIIKTIAAHPQTPYRGAVSHLVHKVNLAAREIGCDQMIHAYMHQDNISNTMSAKHRSILISKYTLYGCDLTTA